MREQDKLYGHPSYLIAGIVVDPFNQLDEFIHLVNGMVTITPDKGKHWKDSGFHKDGGLILTLSAWALTDYSLMSG